VATCSTQDLSTAQFVKARSTSTPPGSRAHYWVPIIAQQYESVQVGRMARFVLLDKS
jgi:hypothetical protein